MGHVHETRSDDDRGSRGITRVSVLGGEGMTLSRCTECPENKPAPYWMMVEEDDTV